MAKVARLHPRRWKFQFKAVDGTTADWTKEMHDSLKDEAERRGMNTDQLINQRLRGLGLNPDKAGDDGKK